MPFCFSYHFQSLRQFDAGFVFSDLNCLLCFAFFGLSGFSQTIFPNIRPNF